MEDRRTCGRVLLRDFVGYGGRRFAATGDRAVLVGVPEEDREFVTGIWPPEFERILNGESASMLAQDAQLGKL